MKYKSIKLWIVAYMIFQVYCVVSSDEYFFDGSKSSFEEFYKSLLQEEVINTHSKNFDIQGVELSTEHAQDLVVCNDNFKNFFDDTGTEQKNIEVRPVIIVESEQENQQRFPSHKQKYTKPLIRVIAVSARKQNYVSKKMKKFLEKKSLYAKQVRKNEKEAKLLMEKHNGDLSNLKLAPEVENKIKNDCNKYYHKKELCRIREKRRQEKLRNEKDLNKNCTA